MPIHFAHKKSQSACNGMLQIQIVFMAGTILMRAFKNDGTSHAVKNLEIVAGREEIKKNLDE